MRKNEKTRKILRTDELEKKGTKKWLDITK